MRYLWIGLTVVGFSMFAGDAAVAGELVPGGWLQRRAPQEAVAAPPPPVASEPQRAVRRAPPKPNVSHPVNRQRQPAPPKDGPIKF